MKFLKGLLLKDGKYQRSRLKDMPSRHFESCPPNIVSCLLSVKSDKNILVSLLCSLFLIIYIFLERREYIIDGIMTICRSDPKTAPIESGR